MSVISIDIPKAWRLRMDTHDLEIYRCVVEQDEYGMRERTFYPDDVVIDVGSHIGWFALAADLAGCKRGMCFEPCRDNFDLLRANTTLLEGKWSSACAAVWRSDVRTAQLYYRYSMSQQNTGGGDVFGMTLPGSTLPTILWVPLDSILMTYEKVRLLKLDCEYSEFPILLTSKQLDRVEEIIGEYHEMGPGTFNDCQIPECAKVDGVESFTREVLKDCLEKAGFTVDIRHEAENIGKFSARRS